MLENMREKETVDLLADMHGESMSVGCYTDQRVHMYGESMHECCVERQSARASSQRSLWIFKRRVQ